MVRPVAAAEVLELALELGFDLAGIAPLHPPRAGDRFRAWLEAGHHADMDWLVEDRDRILDPRQALPAGRSLLVVGLGHSRRGITTPDGARIARYAAGRDYHNVIGRRLRRLAARLRERGILGEWKKVVDAGPLLERSHASEAGLGFESKASNLLHPRFGPWFFLGELLMEAEVEPTPATTIGSCGTCTACLDSCPTQAILAPGVVDARRCLSYQTIENRGAIPHELRAALGAWLFGCDVCSEVCPWGGAAPDLAARFGLHPAVERRTLVDWLRAPRSPRASLEGSPLQRAGDEALARNAAVVLGNRPSAEGREALLEALRAAAPFVREAAFWALAHAHAEDRLVRDRLDRSFGHEEDPTARSGMLRTRELEL